MISCIYKWEMLTAGLNEPGFDALNCLTINHNLPVTKFTTIRKIFNISRMWCKCVWARKDELNSTSTDNIVKNGASRHSKIENPLLKIYNWNDFVCVHYYLIFIDLLEKSNPPRYLNNNAAVSSSAFETVVVQSKHGPL